MVRTLGLYVRIHGSKIVVLLEIKINENRAKKVIKQLEFNRSHRVEAQCFFKGNLDLLEGSHGGGNSEEQLAICLSTKKGAGQLFVHNNLCKSVS